MENTGSARHVVNPRGARYAVRGAAMWGALALSLAPALLLAHSTARASDSQSGRPPVQDVATSAVDDVDIDRILAKAAPETVAELRAIEARVQQVVSDVMAATVSVRVGGAQGSGVIVTSDGVVMTAGHVSGDPGRRATIIMPDGTQLRGETLGNNTGMDSGLVKITDEPEGSSWPFVDKGSSKDLKDGEWVVSLGHPGGYQRGREPVVRLGRVISNTARAVRTDCTLVGGDSGGPLFDMDGKVVGIHSRIARNLSQNYHVPVDTYTETWDQLVAAEIVGPQQPVLGIRGRDHANGGCEVTEVMNDLPALAAGIQVGDIITEFNGTDVEGIDHLIDLVQQRRRGRSVDIVLSRNGQEMTVTAELRRRR